jgi:uncharacterized membrane protein YqiK
MSVTELKELFMMSGDLIAIGMVVLVVFAILVGLAVIVMQFYVKVEQGYAMIVNTLRETPDVTFTGRLVIPIIHKKEFMNISLKTIEIDRQGSEGLICKDNIRADIKVAFFVRVNKTTEDVLRVAQAIGCVRASDHATLDELFNAKFSEALKTVGKQMDFVDLYAERDKFRDDIIRVIGDDLNGYVLEDAAIDYLEQTPVEQLDTNNILDAEGIRKITQLTAEQHILTNEHRREEETKIKKKDVETREKILELERIQADAEARQAREVASVRARETAEQQKIEQEERLKSERARIATEQDIQVQEENQKREVEVAVKNRERALAIEEEKVNRVRQLEIIQREKEVALEQISKEKAVEIEKKEIADVIRERIAVDKTVAEEEERIKELRTVAEAERNKKADIIVAEGLAEQELVKEIKAAEASEQTAVFKAKERLTLAEAEREAASKQADAKKRLAEGVKEERAAPGLAEAMVMEAKALALEKQGASEAKVLQEKMHAQALGKEEIGMADVRIKEADAKSEEEQAMVNVKVQVAEAQAIEKKGEAEANVIRQRLKAEAEGLAEKFKSMSTMNDVVRAHEEFRMELDNAHEQNLKAIVANTEIADKQAEVLAKALEKANIDIVGGDGEFLQTFFKSIAVGKAVDGAIGSSETLQASLMKLLAMGSGDQKFSVPELISTIKGLSRKKDEV